MKVKFLALLLLCCAGIFRTASAAEYQFSVFIADPAYDPVISYVNGTAILTFTDSNVTRIAAMYQFKCVAREFGSTQPYLQRFFVGIVNDTAFLTQLSSFRRNGDSIFQDVKQVFSLVPVCYPNLGLQSKSKQPLILYPNPSNGLLHFHADAALKQCGISVLAMNGQKLRNVQHDFSISADLSFDLNDLPNGIYLIRLISSNGTEQQKRITIQR